MNAHIENIALDTFYGLTGRVQQQFAYDGYSRRITETEKDANGHITQQLKNLWCGETLCAQQDDNGQTINRFFAQGEVQNGKSYLYAQDQVGSVYALVDDQGKVAGRTAYDSYGNITYQTGTQPIMAYAGLYLHKESGLHLATYRAYNPATARWLNRDPIREAGGLNIYAYVEGNPINFVDPNGLFLTVGIPVGSFGFGGATTGMAQDGYKQSSLINAAIPTSFSGPFGPVCGAEGSASASWIPDGIWTDACQQHDECYLTCGVSQSQCDAQFLKKSGNILYFGAVVVFGKSPYKAAQSESACKNECKK